MSKPITERRKAGVLTLTKHACARMRENGLTYSDVEVLWNGAIEEQRENGRSFFDFMKYGTKYGHNVKYYKSNNFRFVVDTKDSKHLKVITLIKT